MATLLGIQTAYKYALRDLGDTLEQINGNPPSPANDVRDKAVGAAINDYSRRLPRTRTVLQTTDPSRKYALPADWQEYSDIIMVEFPIDQIPPIYAPKGAVGFAQTETAGFFFVDPNPTGSFRYTYTTVHGGGADNVSSIPARHETLIGRLAAALVLEESAAQMAQTQANNLDAVNYRTKEQEQRAAAKALRDEADRELRHEEWRGVMNRDPDNDRRKVWRSR